MQYFNEAETYSCRSIFYSSGEPTKTLLHENQNDFFWYAIARIAPTQFHYADVMNRDRPESIEIALKYVIGVDLTMTVQATA